MTTFEGKDAVRWANLCSYWHAEAERRARAISVLTRDVERLRKANEELLTNALERTADAEEAKR